MSLPKLEIEKFTIDGDFSLWKMKIRAMLVHQGLESALEEEDPKGAPSSMFDETRRQALSRARSTLISSRSVSILRKISGKKIALGIWNKIEALYMKSQKAVYFLYERWCVNTRIYWHLQQDITSST